MFERLEQRALLTRVFGSDLFVDAAAVSGYQSPTGAAILDSGGIEYIEANSPYSEAEIFRVRGTGASEAFQRTRILNSKTTYGTEFSPRTTPSGDSVFFGRFAAELEPGSMFATPAFDGIAYLRSWDAQPSTIFYEDTDSPHALVSAVGVATVYGMTFKVTTQFYDNDGLLDVSSIGVDSIRMVSAEGTVGATQFLVRSTTATKVRQVQVTYWFDLPVPQPAGTWDTNPSDYYSIEFVADTVKDEVGHANAGSTLRGVRVYGPGADSLNAEWGPPDLLPLEKLPADRMVGVDGLIGRDKAWSSTVDPLVTSRDGMLIFRAYDGENWATYWADDFGIEADAPINYLPQSMASNGASVTVNVDRTGILYSSGPGVAPSLAFMHPGLGNLSSQVSQPVISLDGSFVVFAAEIQWTTGIFGAFRSDGQWQVDKLLSGSDGILEPGETWIDSNGDDGITGAWVSEDALGDATIWLDSRLALTEPEASGRFSIVWSAVHLYRLEVSFDPAEGGRLAAGVPETIAESHTDSDSYTSSLFGPERHSPRKIASDVDGISLLQWPANASGDLGTWIASSDASAPQRFVRFTDLGLRPLLFLPGIFGTMPGDDDIVDWLMYRGFDPEKLVLDPLAGTYDNAVQALIDVGYVLDGHSDPTLYLANYDWRMPPAPVHENPGAERDGPWRRDPDGVIKGINRDTLFDTKYEHGVEYLAYWLRKAKLEWESRTGRTLDSVDIYAHSTGGLVTRAYIQSDLYGDDDIDLPTVNHFISMAVPHRGASKAWNLMHDNMASDIIYKTFFSKVAYAAYWKLTTSGRPIGSATPGDEITLARLEQAVRDFPDVYGADTHEQALHQAFINLYIPTGRALLATYPFILDSSGNYIPAPAAKQNALALDLNNGIDSFSGNDLYIRDKTVFIVAVSPAFLERADVAFFYGTAAAEGTYTHAKERQGPSRELIPGPPGYPPAWTLPYEQPIYPMDSVLDARAPGTDEIWWADTFDGPVATTRRLDGSGPQSVSRHGGDATVPTFSAGLGFGSSWYARYYPQTDPAINHGSINGDPKVLTEVLKELNVPAFIGTIEPNWRSSINLPTIVTILDEVRAYFTNDPVEGFLTDGLGRRLGWTQATGVLREIPGGVYIGEGDGFGWIYGDFVAPLTYTFTGVEATHSVAVGFVEGDKIRTFKSEGPIGIGFTRTVQGSEFAIAGPPPSVVHALLGAVPNISVGPGGAITVAVINQHGRTTLFSRPASSNDWSASEPDQNAAAGTPTSDAVTWRDPKDGKFYASVPTEQGLLLFREDATGQWTARNLTSEIAGSGMITSKITQWKTNATRNNVFRVVGTLANGDVVQYEQTLTGTANGYKWNYKNLSDDLRAIGQVTPQFAGRLVAYTTAWDAWHIAGLDADGQIQTIWRGPKMSQWVLSNLSAVTGAPNLSGGLSVYLTPWQGINLAGVDQNGQLQVTWWVPRFVGMWVVSNLTSSIAAPMIDGSSIVSFNTPAGGLNMAARTTDDELVVFWWVPGAPGNKWRVQQVSHAVSPSGTVVIPQGELSAASGGDGLTSIVGRGPRGEVVRFHGSVIDQSWDMESLTETAQLL